MLRGLDFSPSACIIARMKELDRKAKRRRSAATRFVGKAVPLLPETLLQKVYKN